MQEKKGAAEYILVIGNKNYSSWSLRAWLMMKASGASFKEILIPLDQENSRKEIRRYSPSGLVPVLLADGVPIWESLAIGEYLAETFPDALLWPQEKRARAHARSISSEMHAGFAALRSEYSMNMRHREAMTLSPKVAEQIARIETLWEEARSLGQKGDFLYGVFGIADAMYAPVVSRFVTYGFAVSKESKRYMDAIWGYPPFVQWLEEAQAEPWVL